LQVKKPTVENPNLQKIINGMWSDRKDAVGDGSIMDAIRQERKTDTPTKGRVHSQKGRETITRLDNWLRSKTSPKPDSDKKTARILIKEIRDALSS
jgi:hypothetical protein